MGGRSFRRPGKWLRWLPDCTLMKALCRKLWPKRVAPRTGRDGEGGLGRGTDTSGLCCFKGAELEQIKVAVTSRRPGEVVGLQPQRPTNVVGLVVGHLEALAPRHEAHLQGGGAWGGALGGQCPFRPPQHPPTDTGGWLGRRRRATTGGCGLVLGHRTMHKETLVLVSRKKAGDLPAASLQQVKRQARRRWFNEQGAASLSAARVVSRRLPKVLRRSPAWW
jgi:hypothetical protein